MNDYDLSRFKSSEPFADRTAEAKAFLGKACDFFRFEESPAIVSNVWVSGRMVGPVERFSGISRFLMGTRHPNTFLYCVDVDNRFEDTVLNLEGMDIQVYGDMLLNNTLIAGRPEKERFMKMGAIYARSPDALVQLIYHEKGLLRYDTHRQLALVGSKV